MKKLAAILALIAGASSQTAVADPQSYRMKCKPGPGMYIDYRGGDNLVLVNFRRARNGRDPQPGACMWDRRNLYQDEPNRLCHWGVDDIRFITNDQQELQVLTSSDARYLRSIHANSDLVFFVDAYNDRQGCLRVTQVHPYVQNRFQQQAPAGK